MTRNTFPVLLLLTILFVGAPHVHAQNPSTPIGFERYYERTEFLMASPGAMKFGLYGYHNPAVLHYLHAPDLLLQWTAGGEYNRFGVFAGLPSAGLLASSFSFVNHDFPGFSYRDYRFAYAGGNDALAAGLAVNFFQGDTDILDLKTNITFGVLARPSRYVSLGVTSTSTLQGPYYETVAELAIRPFGNERLALFGDFATGDRDEDLLRGAWSAGAALELLPGVRFTSRYIDNAGITAGLQFSLGRAGVSAQSHRDRDGNHRFNSYGVRLGAMDRNLRSEYWRKDRTYVSMSFRGSMPYQPFRFFDKRTPYLKILDAVYEAAADPSVSGLVISTVGMQIDQTKTWELHQALVHARARGKRVVVYVERGGMFHLHLASAADYVVMDPMGALTIPGFVSGTTYIADLLSAVGIGVDEFREMEYKSAFEALSRTEMTDADREQRQLLIDRFYELIRSDVSASSNLDYAGFDELIDRGIALSPRDLVQAGIVDTLARFSEIDDIIEKLEDGKRTRIGPGQLYAYERPRDDVWGKGTRIAVLYAQGPTMTESGIRARTLSAAIRDARNDSSVKAVVLRADSPGGDALASDLVAEELRKTSEEKPVIVSMGSVAASGGYWISMYADSIVAAPNTITGSIGVISGWLWDEGLSDRLRLQTDYVSRGASADLTHGPTLPLIGLSLPNRPLRDTEREMLVNRMNELYDEFIEKVASGRGVEPEQIREVAAGRVWSGIDALENGLVDELGNLYAAIGIAREKAGIAPSERVTIVEGPQAQAFSLGALLGGVLGTRSAAQQASDPVKAYLELMIENNAVPLTVMPFEYLQWLYYLNGGQ